MNLLGTTKENLGILLADNKRKASCEYHLNWEEAVEWLKSRPEYADLITGAFYDDPLRGAAERFFTGTEWKAVTTLLPTTPGRALDLGAGRGIASFALARIGWETTALEPDPSNKVGAGAIRSLAAETGLKIRVETGWGESLPFPDGTFDLVYCRQVLHHARALPDLCREVARVMKPGARLLATREHVLSRSEDLPAFLASHPLHRLYGGENAFRLQEYCRALQGAGLRIRKIFNPVSSDINLYPSTIQEYKRNLCRKAGFPWPHLVPDAAIFLYGKFMQIPGRLYSFVADKWKG